MIKWLTNITISETESQSFYHYMDNRVLPSSVDQERADRERWWYKPDYIINDLNLNSAITHPVRRIGLLGLVWLVLVSQWMRIAHTCALS